MSTNRLALFLAGVLALACTAAAFFANDGAGVATAGNVRLSSGAQTDTADQPEAVPGELVVQFDRSERRVSRASAIAAAGATLERDLNVRGFTLVRVAPGDEAEAAARLRAQPGVISAEPNYIRRIAFMPDDEHYPLQWNLPQIGLPEAWDHATGAGVIVAVLDTGVAYEDCPPGVCGSDQYFEAPDFGSTTFVSPRDIVSGDGHPNDRHGHGTHVASTVAESTDNGIGAAGVAFDASIMPVKVCGNDGNCETVDVADGIDWAVSHGADVINLSLGGPSGSPAELAAVQDAVASGVVVVAAAGNGGDDGVGDAQLDCPACFPNTISVGATGRTMQRAGYSNYGMGISGHTLDIVAPGGSSGSGNGILQQTFRHACGGSFDLSDFIYCYYSGTSMASPHIAGVVALMLDANPSLTPAQVRQILRDTATDLGGAGYDLEYGSGLVNAAAAVEAAEAAVATPTPAPTDTPVPSDTPAPTDTPVATNTPAPTDTPAPTFTPASTSTPTRTPTPPCPAGDVNQSGSANSVDAALVLQLAARIISSVTCLPAADVNGDGRTDAVDSAIILQFDAGLLASLPV